MGLTRLAAAYARQRPLATLLVVMLLAVGTAVATLTIMLARELETRMTRDAEGIDLVVGAKGSPLQLVLAGVYHVDVPPGNIPLEALEALRADPLIASAIPLALGDSFGGFRIVGTEPALIDHYRAHVALGRVWTGTLEAVVGSEVARATGLDVGAQFEGSHGLAEASTGGHADAHYRVVGVLAPTGSVVDRLVLTSIESVWDVHAQHRESPAADASAVEEAQTHADAHDAAREVTMVLVRYAGPVAAASLPRRINAETHLVAASPAYETARLLSVFGVGVDLMRGFGVLLIAASGLMLFVALSQSLEERRHDLAILRALGAHRGQIAGVLAAESVGLAAIGALLGWALAHGLALLVGRLVPAAAPLAAAALGVHRDEVIVAGIALAAGILSAIGPAVRAYRLDVAATLADR